MGFPRRPHYLMDFRPVKSIGLRSKVSIFGPTRPRSKVSSSRPKDLGSIRRPRSFASDPGIVIGLGSKPT